ncbi:extracellular catalytic domain type 1 short-chain-length polyhydroxyalkanoate depolymerase [Geminicoccus roseus]|uniref:extracellular catalytic domain type 1 short-chain-length polyhydroxyalkanoate depolymerase n=1 Tax=Geminicoccus roseus TaxID=404900 RepID=UPI00041B14CE|nr:PHB depolymerase family esterase [Geminicoccus roseus]
MTTDISQTMAEAMRLIRAGRLGEATAQLRQGRGTSAMPSADLPSAGAGFADLRSHLPKDLQGLQGLQGLLRQRTPAEPLPDGAAFLERRFTDRAGSRDYRLYVPSRAGAEPMPLVVMLHGCTQDPADFAAGTGMNRQAERHGLLIAYPEQPQTANPSRCWNWFEPGHQRHGQGEPALIAGITRDILREHPVDPGRVYIAGLSAGGAAALAMALLYPDLYAAAGVHSGLPFGAAQDMNSAFAAMRQGDAPGRQIGAAPAVPTIVFHGTQDGTVHPRNAMRIIDQIRQTTAPLPVERHAVNNGHAYTRTVYADGSGRAMHEHWAVQGAGHAWFGGSAAGSYTDPKGPDASAEMIRFFLQHRVQA